MNRWLALPLLALVGCGPETYTVSVAVRNEYVEPVTVVLMKEGVPLEVNWLAPEDYGALLHAPPEAKVNGVVVPPGKTVSQSRDGKFYDSTRPVLRVYRGKQTVESMLGIGPNSPNRSTVQLSPGDNVVVIDAAGVAVRR